MYACADEVTGFMELLAPYRTEVQGQRRALQPLADSLGVPLDTLWRDIVDEWDTSGTMKASWLPTSFRDGRALYTLSLPQGWWVDVTTTETIAALGDLLEDHLDEPLTMSHVSGEDRLLTTKIADVLRNDVTLDDGSLPRGIRFVSKHGSPSSGSGVCWAYWLREHDSGLAEPAQVINRQAIEETNTAFAAALQFCKIKTR